MRCAAALVALWCSFLLGPASAAVAQQTSPPDPPSLLKDSAYAPLSADQVDELTKWLSAMEKWQRYDAKFDNRPVRNGWGRIVDRKPPPIAPEWLEAHCAAAAAAGLAEVDARTTKACRLLADARASFAPVPPAVQAAESTPHSSFLTRVHFDFLSTTTSTGGRLYGIIGSHISLVDVGRVQIFGPPGVILLTVPDERGGRRVTLGYTWGVSVRLMDVRLGAPTKNLTLFVNVSKVWVSGGPVEGGGSAQGFDIVGFSIAPRKRR